MGNGTLANRAIVIAGAGSGMGRATALAAAAAGANLVLVARSSTALDDIVRDITAAGGSATAIPTDVTDHAAVAALMDEALARLGRIDALINTVGTNIKGRALGDLTAESWNAMLAVNLTSAFNLTQAVVPAMRRQGAGLIVHVSSSAAKKPDPSGVAYQATKAGLVGLAHGTMEEERQHGIRTSVIFPGLTDTPMVLKRPTPTPPDVLARALQPEDVAAAVMFILGLPARTHVPELLLYPSGI
ncbi:MAG: SDR family oxidoreductase [Chloroflexia bacterium]|nr:SDR family oxidoreductase [Chloroflexia bacterium]